jgi:hypothetical protein
MDGDICHCVTIAMHEGKVLRTKNSLVFTSVVRRQPHVLREYQYPFQLPDLYRVGVKCVKCMKSLLLTGCLVTMVSASLIAASCGIYCFDDEGQVGSCQNDEENLVEGYTDDIRHHNRIHGTIDMSDFCCLCHQQNAFPLQQGWSAWAVSVYCGPLWDGSAHNDVDFYVNKGSGPQWEHYTEAWIYT